MLSAVDELIWNQFFVRSSNCSLYIFFVNQFLDYMSLIVSCQSISWSNVALVIHFENGNQEIKQLSLRLIRETGGNELLDPTFFLSRCQMAPNSEYWETINESTNLKQLRAFRCPIFQLSERFRLPRSIIVY